MEENVKYEYELLKVGDADAILIRHYINNIPYIVLIDAGNVGDGSKIKEHLKKYYDTTTIDLAICTHPDKDHKGGFFDLLNDEEICIIKFWLTDPARFLTEDDLKRYTNSANAQEAVRKIYNKPGDDSQNLLNLACQKCTTYSVLKDWRDDILPFSVLGPRIEYYQEIVKDMVYECGIETYDESDAELYEDTQVDEDDAKSVIDECDDGSPFNKSSLIILYEPEDGKHILFAGDATCTSLDHMIEDNPDLKNIDFLKVPHHGSKHNLNTKIIEKLAPQQSCISAVGNRKHPNSAIVYWLSKYGNVYSTHKCNLYLLCSTNIPSRANSATVLPLKSKKE